MRFRNVVTLPLIVLAGASLAAVLAACGGHGHHSATGATGAVAITCTTSAGSVPAGGSVVAVTATVTRDGVAAPNETVVFSTLGSVQPDVGSTGTDGRITSFFLPPSQAGIAVLGARVFSANPLDALGTTCPVTVTGTTNPQLSITVVSPASLAGLTVHVGYDSTTLSLPAGSATAQGAFAGADCFFQPADNGAGTVTLTIACPSLRLVGGTEVTRLPFVSRGGIRGAGDFVVTCDGVDDAGRPVGTACSTSVTQL